MTNLAKVILSALLGVGAMFVGANEQNLPKPVQQNISRIPLSLDERYKRLNEFINVKTEEKNVVETEVAEEAADVQPIVEETVEEVVREEVAQRPKQSETKAVEPVAPKYQQYVTLNGNMYPFSTLPVDTKAAQHFIDTQPGSYGLWNNVTYAGVNFDILFAHYYAAGEMVYNASIGDVITLHYENGAEVKYQVQSKIVVGVNEYYSRDTSLWNHVGSSFDLMIKTCYDVNVTDLVITLVRV